MFQIYLFVFVSCFLLSACSKSDSSSSDESLVSEVAQQVGDVMTSVDESSGASSGSFAELHGYSRTLARLDPPSVFEKLKDFILPEAIAARCSAAQFSACDGAGQRVRTFEDCTIGLATFNGSVALSFSANDCRLTDDGSMVARTPNFQVNGRRNGTLSVSKVGTVGQLVTHVSGHNFTFANDGIRRVFSSGNETFLDFTTQTTSEIAVTGSFRSGRMMDGGALRVTNNLSGTTCDFSPSFVTWDASCNCPVSGAWAGSCSDSKTMTLEITGCGTAQLTVNGSAENVRFDRCYSLTLG